MKNISIWKDTITSKKYNKLDKDIDVDVLIIGGGITGISTLYHLKNSNLNCALVEQGRIGYSTTSNSTGKLNYLQNDLIDNIRKTFNDKVASIYLKSQIEIIKEIVNTIKSNKIDCDLERTKAYLYTNKDNEIDKIKKLESFLNKNNIKTNCTDNSLVKSKYMIEVNNTYLIHPLKFIYGLLNNNKYSLYEDTSIKKIKKINDYYICYTTKYKIKAKYVVIATHYPYFLKPMFFPIKCSLKKSYLSASIYNTNSLSLISYKKPFISIRNYKKYLIYLSNSHRISSKINDKEHYDELIKKLNNLNINPSYLWSNIDIITNDYLPYIGRIKDNLLIGTGYNTWGLTNGFLAGIILSDIILNKNNKYIKLFNPNRFNLSQITNGVVDALESIEGYINGYINAKDSINNDKVTKICPHLGCKLSYNEIEKTWDCPCHGSRFDENGNIIMAPSNKNIKK